MTGRSVTIYGATARIEYNNPDLCGSEGTSPSASAIWSMVYSTSASNSNIDAYAQTGYEQGQLTPNNAIRIFSEYTAKCSLTASCTGSSLIDTVANTTPTSRLTYSNYWYNGSDGLIHMFAGGKSISTTGYNPTGDWNPSWQGQYFGETHDLGSDVPGTTDDRANMSNVETRDGSGNNGFASVSYKVTPGANRYHSLPYTPTDGGHGIQVYTNPTS